MIYASRAQHYMHVKVMHGTSWRETNNSTTQEELANSSSGQHLASLTLINSHSALPKPYKARFTYNSLLH